MADIQPTSKTTHTYQPYTPKGKQAGDKTTTKLHDVVTGLPHHLTAPLQQGTTPLSKHKARPQGDDLSKRLFS